MTQKIRINPTILTWGREQAGLSVGQLAELANISPIKSTKNSRGMSAEERIYLWETGKDSPTFAQLQSIAKVFQRPIMTFFLSRPPAVSSKLIDFRTIDSRPHVKDSPAFARLKRRLELLQDNLSEIAQATLPHPLEFVGSIGLNVDIDDFVRNARSAIGLTFEEQISAKDDEALFRLYRKKIQDAGVYVVIEGDLGSYHSAISTDEFRGIAISDEYAPLIAINSKDMKQAQLFTLLHEFAHIWLGDASVSNVALFGNSVDKKEQFCNAFAAEMLLPKEVIETINIPDKNGDNNFAVIADYARMFKVSIMVMARRLFDFGKISKKCYEMIIASIKKTIANKKQKIKETTQTIISRDVLDRHRLGDKVLTSIKNATDNGMLTLADASVLLNISSIRLNKV